MQATDYKITVKFNGKTFGSTTTSVREGIDWDKVRKAVSQMVESVKHYNPHWAIPENMRDFELTITPFATVRGQDVFGKTRFLGNSL